MTGNSRVKSTVPKLPKRPRREVTRKEAAHRIGCSEWQISKFAETGQLKFRREKGNGEFRRVWYDADGVNSLASTWERKRQTKLEKIDSKVVETNVRGKIAAKAMPMFRDCASLHEERDMLTAICVACEADPWIIQDLYEYWKSGPSGIIREKERKRREAEERAERKRHEYIQSTEEYRRYKLQLTRLEASKPAPVLVVEASTTEKESAT